MRSTRSLSLKQLTRRASVTALLFLSGLVSCASLFEQKTSLRRVSDLVGWVEHVHVDAELVQARMHEALDGLLDLTARDFSGDPLKAYEAYAKQVEAARKQHHKLRASFWKMEKAAEDVFANWTSRLAVFTSETMRRRSEQRLEDTRQRYAVVHAAVGPAVELSDRLLAGLQDSASFLANDFNAAALREIDADVRSLTDEAAEFDDLLREAMKAARQYAEEASLHGQVDEPATSVEPARKGGAQPARKTPAQEGFGLNGPVRLQDR